MPRMVVRSLAWGLVIGVTACASEPLTRPVPEAESPTIEANPLRNTYFGDLHIHTKYSFDAFIFNTRTTPDDAYRYAKGEAIQHGAGFPIQLQSGPLDFYAVTDHAMFLGIVPAMVDPTTAISRQDIAQSIANASTVDELRSAFRGMFSMLQEGFDDSALLDKDIVRSAWADIVAATERHNDPGQFTTFVAFEYTSGPQSQNLHRNVIFRGSEAPDIPFS